MQGSRDPMKRSRPSFDEASIGIRPPNGSESITRLASRVLFGNTLEEKLRLSRPESLVYDKPNAPELYRGVIPGRPENLGFASESETRPTFPRTPAMVEEESRGVLLHFFANHELLAAELMALAILKFPNAPRAFREGLARTLREEQLHTRWYVNRMQQCGINFGQYPLNRFFWDVVSSMETPLDYVSRLSLTFEQANLDYARHYANVLHEAGDKASASLLNRIYHDEISHVGYGLHWFRQWKNEEHSDWEALKRQLTFPLSPTRAKGNRAPFNVAGRREAGFDTDYIQQLSLFERSRGRTPNIYCFNPEAENRVACHPAAYHPNKRIQSVILDLEILPAFLARRDDVVLMRKPPSSQHRLRLAEVGFELPEIDLLASDGHLRSDSLLTNRKINQVRPWSRSPDIPDLFAGLSQINKPVPKWKPANRSLFSKALQIQALQRWMGPGRSTTSGDDLVQAALSLAKQGWTEFVLKRPFSTAGGGMKRLTIEEVLQYRGKGMSEKIISEGGLIIEPAHDRILDFSIQYLIEGKEIRQLGLIEQIISPSGQYLGSLSFPKFCSGMKPDIAQFLMEKALPQYANNARFTKSLRDWAEERNFEGPLGVDAYLYRDSSGSLQHRTACEVNPRFTMGRVALDIRRQVAPGHGVCLEIVKAAKLQQRDESVQLLDGRLASGSLVLNEITPHSHFAARIRVAKQKRSLESFDIPTK
jgi:uncharacterized ferritin-like protein (DUF455 family)